MTLVPRPLVLALAAGVLAASPASADPLVVTANTNALALVNLLVGGNPDIQIVSASYTGSGTASGTFTGGTGIIPFDSGVLLTSGNINLAPGPNGDDAATAINGVAGDADLDVIAADSYGTTTFDASVLEFSFIPTGNVISFQYAFASEEYNEYANTEFNDVFAFFLNLNGDPIESNIALIPGTGDPVTINAVNCGTINAAWYTNNDPDPLGAPPDTNGEPCDELTQPSAGLNVQYDGLVGASASPAYWLFATGSVIPNQVNTIKLAIADSGDEALDSGVFLKSGSFVNEAPPEAAPVPEPTTLSLLGAGLLVAARRLRSRRAAAMS